jgi:hypothetical protein
LAKKLTFKEEPVRWICAVQFPISFLCVEQWVWTLNWLKFQKNGIYNWW